MADHKKITTDQLLAYADGELDPAAAEHVEAHVQSDPEASATVERYQRMRALTAADDSIAPPAEVVERARAIFQPRTRLERAGEWLRSLEETIASLVYDSRLQPAAVRYADASQRFQLTYEVDEVEVDLQFDRASLGPAPRGDAGEQGWRVMGQVTSESSGSRQPVAIRRTDGEIVAETEIDERDMFAAELTPGRYDVLIGQGERAIRLSDIELE
jgi:hypothetical protein